VSAGKTAGTFFDAKIFARMKGVFFVLQDLLL